MSRSFRPLVLVLSLSWLSLSTTTVSSLVTQRSTRSRPPHPSVVAGTVPRLPATTVDDDEGVEVASDARVEESSNDVGVDDDDSAAAAANVRAGSLAAATATLGKVPYGETSRKYRRTVFAHQDWVTQRSSNSRLLENLKSMFFSGVVRQLRPQVGITTTVATVVLLWNVGVLQMLLHNGELTIPNGGPLVALRPVALPTLPFTLSSPALGLLLVFRTNASYARWNEARTTWGKIVSHAGNLVRMSSVFSDDREAVERFSRIVWLYVRTVMNRLSSPEEDEEAYREQVAEVFFDDDYDDDDSVARRVASSPRRTAAAWRELTIALHDLPASDPKPLLETDKSVIVLGDCAAACEKIFSSPVPLVYTRHTARFLSLWTLLVPLALYQAFAELGAWVGVWAVPLASGLLAFFFFGVDELAMQLEEPFSILPMQKFCDDVRETNEELLSSRRRD